MPRFQYLETYDLGVAIFATSKHHSPFSSTVIASDVSADADGKKVLPAGQFVCQYGDRRRFLPRGYASSAFTSGSPSGGAIEKRYQMFIPGDDLWLLQPSGSVTLGGTWLATETITLTLGDSAMTFVAGDTVRANIVANAVSAIKSNPIFNNLVEAVPIGDVLSLFARKWDSLPSLTVATNSAAGTTTRSAANFMAPAKIGTISSVAPTTGAIALAGNAEVSVPVGARVGVPVSKVIGIYGHSIDLATAPREVFSYSEADIYEMSLPYLDDDIKRQCPQLTFSVRF